MPAKCSQGLDNRLGKYPATQGKAADGQKAPVSASRATHADARMHLHAPKTSSTHQQPACNLHAHRASCKPSAARAAPRALAAGPGRRQRQARVQTAKPALEARRGVAKYVAIEPRKHHAVAGVGRD